MPENRHLRFLLRLLYAALALAGLWLCVRFLLPWLLPFLLAWGLAALLEPAVGLLMRRLRLPRWGAAALCTAALAAALLGLLALALWRAWYELTRLVARLPVLLSGLPALAEELGEALAFTRRFIRCDVLDEPVGPIHLCGYTAEQLREVSHYPDKHLGQPHFLPSCTDAHALLAVNRARTVARQTELAAYAAFRDADGGVTRDDIIQGLNRLSSLLWILMCKCKGGHYAHA